MNLSTEQKDALKRFEASWKALRMAEVDLEARVAAYKRQEQATIEALRRKAAEDAATAVAMEVPKRQLARDVMGQTGTVALYRMLGLLNSEGAASTPTAPKVALSQEFVRNGDTIIVTPPRVILEPLLAPWGQTPESVDKGGLWSAEFDLDGKPITENYTPETGRHPVVAYVLSNPAYAAKIREAGAA